MPFSQKLDEDNKKIEVNRNNSLNKNCLTPKQTEYIYKKVELGHLINKNTIKEKTDPDIELDKIHDNSGVENPYQELIVNNASKVENMISQMEQWSILSNVRNYLHYSKNPKNFHAVSIKPINKNKVSIKEKEKVKFSLQVGLINASGRLTEEYLGMYEGVTSEILNTTRFNENSDLSMAYIGKSNMTRTDKMAVEERFTITDQGYTVGKLSDSTECQILLDTGVSKSFLSKSHYLHCKSLHSLPKFTSETQRIQVGNGRYVSVQFVIPVIIDIHGHRFIIYTLVSKIHENVDMVLGIKNVFKLEGVVNSCECCFSFLNRSVLLFPKKMQC